MKALIAAFIICVAGTPTMAAPATTSPRAGEKGTMLRWTVGCPVKGDRGMAMLIRGRDGHADAKAYEEAHACALVRGGADVLVEKTSWGGGPSCVREPGSKACIWVAQEHVGKLVAPIVDPATGRQFAN